MNCFDKKINFINEKERWLKCGCKMGIFNVLNVEFIIVVIQYLKSKIIKFRMRRLSKNIKCSI